MQDEVNEKVVALSIKTSKLTAEVLQKAMKAVLAKGKQFSHRKRLLFSFAHEQKGATTHDETEGENPRGFNRRD